MADTLITNLTNVPTPTGAEEVPVNVPGTPDTDGKVVLSALAAYVEGTLGLGTAATTAATDYATAAQGALADTATQPGDLGGAAVLNVGTTAGTVAAGDDSRFTDSRTPTAHAASHVNGTDDIQNATASQKGLATAAQITKLDGIEALADVTDAGNVGSSIHGATAKTTPVDADTVPLIDSAASNVLKKLSWANIKATLKTYFDAIYLVKTVYDPQNAGRISGADGVDAVLYGGASGGTGGTLSMDGGNASSFMETAIAAGNAGSINTSGGSADGAQTGGAGGSINTSGSPGLSGGSINTTAGGSITSGSGNVNLGNTSGTLDPHALSPLPAVAVELGYACSDETTALTTGEKVAFYAPIAFTLTSVEVCVNTAPTGSALTVDVESPAGTSLLSSVASISASAFTATGSVSGGSQSIAKGARVSIDIDQIGATIAGAGLKVTLIGTRA